MYENKEVQQIATDLVFSELNSLDSYSNDTFNRLMSTLVLVHGVTEEQAFSFVHGVAQGFGAALKMVTKHNQALTELYESGDMEAFDTLLNSNP